MTDPTGGYGPRYADATATPVPRMLGARYELAQQIGRGGMAEVYSGRDTRLGRTVAVKVLKTDLARDPAFQSRFKREAQSAASLNHPAIVAVYDTGDEEMTDPGGGVSHLPYIVMEYLQGRTLKEVLAQHHRLSVEDSLRVTAGVLDALQYSHQNGIVHRDIKPANVMVTDGGEIKVMDFGIARAIADTGATMTGTNAVLGTAQYLSPEQARGETVDNRSDLYSTACLLYELLTGRPPFVGDSPVSLAYQHVGEQPQPPSTLVPGLSADLDRVVMRGLSKDRTQRYQSADEFIADLDRVANGLPVSAPDATQAVRPPVPAAATQRIPAAASATAAWPPAGGAAPPSNYDPRYASGYGPDGYDRDRYDREDEPERRSLAWLWILLGVLAIIVVAVVAWLFTQAGGDGEAAPETPAPSVTAAAPVALEDVTGRPYAEAVAALNAAGFTTVTREDREDLAAEPDTVLEQRPGASTSPIPVDTQIVLVVAVQPGQVQVPDVSGSTQAEARAALEAAGLELGEVNPEDAPNVERGLVARTEPEAGGSAPPGTAVNLFTSSGQVDVPDLRGLALDDAEAQAAERGLQLDQELVNSDEAPGTVVEQDPVNGRVDNGSTINVTVSTGPAVTVTATPTPPTTTTSSSTTSSSSSSTTAN